MASSQLPTKIQRGLKFTENFDDKPFKNLKREKPGHKSFQFSKNF